MKPQKTTFKPARLVGAGKPASLGGAGKQTETCLRVTRRQVGLIPEEWEVKKMNLIFL